MIRGLVRPTRRRRFAVEARQRERRRGRSLKLLLPLRRLLGLGGIRRDDVSRVLSFLIGRVEYCEMVTFSWFVGFLPLPHLYPFLWKFLIGPTVDSCRIKYWLL